LARYKAYSYDQIKLVPLVFSEQLLPGTFEYALNHIVDHELDLSIFLARYKNDTCGASAYAPALLLKIVFFAYAHGITSSRKIESCCQHNILFKALSADTVPHYTTIANFISGMSEEITPLFRNVLLICDDLGLIGKDMFAIDGCKLPSNASKAWSGTHVDLAKKKDKIEKVIGHILKRHRAEDQLSKPSESTEKKRAEQLKKLRKTSDKIKQFLSENQDRVGTSGKVIKSNITDNQSAKMTSAHGVVQGDNGIAVADAKHQIVVSAEAIGSGSEHQSLKPQIENDSENFKSIGKEDPQKEVTLLGDSGFHSEKNMKYLAEEKIDSYIADKRFRKREPRFKSAERYKKPINKTKSQTKKSLFKPVDFKMDERSGRPICPAGNSLYLKNSNIVQDGKTGKRYMARESDCKACPIRNNCMREAPTKARQVTFFDGKTEPDQETLTQKMIKKIDSDEGRDIYSQRMGLIEPVFANIRSTLRLNRFSLRGQTKVNIQWLLFCITHNLGKIQRYGLQTT